MWRVVAAALGFIAGCNWVFGLDDTVERPPADAPPDAPPSRVELKYLTSVTDMFGAPSTPILETIAPAPDVKSGPIGGELSFAVYADGEFTIPGELTGEPFRVEYTVAGAAPIEVHWAPPRDAGKLVVPVFGRLARASAPNGTANYQVSPTGAPALQGARVFTTGYWSSHYLGAASSPLVIDAAALTPLSGPTGVPEMAAQDIFVVIDYGAAAGCANARGRTEFIAPNLNPGPSPTVVMPPPAWSISQKTANIHFEQASSTPAQDVLSQRLSAALGSRYNGVTFDPHVRLGRFPSLGMPAFTQPPPTEITLREPLMIPVADCPIMVLGNTNDQSSEAYAEPAAITVFPAVVHAYATTHRSQPPVLGPNLVSGIAAVNLVSPGMQEFVADLRAPFVTAPITFGALDLAGPTDQLTFTGEGHVDLSFGMESVGTGFVVHYLEVVLYRITTMPKRLEPVRFYVITDIAARKLTIDTSILTPGEYVFSLHAVRGRPRASLGDFTASEFPQIMTTVFTRSFVKS